MRQYPKAILTLLLCLCIALPGVASALEFGAAPQVLRPGKYYDIAVTAEQATNATLQLVDFQGTVIYTIYDQYPLAAGSNSLPWDGLRVDHSVTTQGEYILRIQTADGSMAETPLRIGAPYPLIMDIMQDSHVVNEQTPMRVSFAVSETGMVNVKLFSYGDGSTTDLENIAVQQGDNDYLWAGMVNNALAVPGDYALMLTLVTTNGESISQRVFVTVEAEQAETAQGGSQSMVIVDVTPGPTPEPTPIPTPEPPLLSPPYSDANDGGYWSMTPGELDDEVIWNILMQPITVYDDGKITATEHVYLMENPDGTGEKVAQIHGKSQGLHVIGEVNEHGYVLVEAFSNYDRSYSPKTDEEREHAFDVKQGYLLAKGLKEVEVKQDMALLVDKLTQRMYLYIDGVRVTEYLIATGKFTNPNDYLYETTPGEFITISHTGGFWSGNMYCDMAIRINGGILLHEVPHKVNADKSKNYSSFEGYLGTKQSHGCIRIQRLKTPEGYNHRWLWENFDRKGGYKVIIWDDLNRVDTPTTWQENPKN